MAVLLTFVAGWVDIVGYLAVYHLFTANMTGTTVHLGHDLITGQYAAAVIALSVIGAFLLGSVGGRALIEVGARLHVRSIASITITVDRADSRLHRGFRHIVWTSKIACEHLFASRIACGRDGHSNRKSYQNRTTHRAHHIRDRNAE